MIIELEYEASWRNSLLQGSNNEPLPSKGREYVGSMTALKKEGNFIQNSVSIDTVMGVLNRLIGDQRKLYQSRSDTNYYFSALEQNVSWEDQPTSVNQEVTYVRNMKGSTDENAFTGLLRTTTPIFNADYAEELWSVLWLEEHQIADFICGNLVANKKDKPEPLEVVERFASIRKLSTIPVDEKTKLALNKLEELFPKQNYPIKDNKVKVEALFCSALYIHIEKLKSRYDISSALTKTGLIRGISKANFTKKDFMAEYVATGAKKLIWGNPYVKETRVKGEGQIKNFLTKASGKLKIELNLPLEKAVELRKMIDNAGVSSFYLGKKGLAYVTQILI